MPPVPYETLLECALALVLMVCTLAVVVPFVPVFAIMWLVALGYAFLAGWNGTTVAFFVVLTLLALAGLLADNVAMGMGAAQGGVRWTSIALAFGAGLVAAALWPPFGGLVAMPVVLFLAEWARWRDMARSWQGVKGWLKGWGMGFVARLILGLMFTVVWSIWAFLT